MSDPVILHNPSPFIPDEVYAYFNISDPRDRVSSGINSKLNNILAFAWEKTGGGDTGNLLEEIRKIENTFGATALGTTRLDNFYHYTTIQRQINSLNKESKALFNIKDNASGSS